jgi:hypothetical protein
MKNKQKDLAVELNRLLKAVFSKVKVNVAGYSTHTVQQKEWCLKIASELSESFDIPKPKDIEELYFIGLGEYSGTSMTWYKKASNGLTENIDEAGRFNKEEALLSIKFSKSIIAYPVSYVLANTNPCVTKHLDIGKILK